MSAVTAEDWAAAIPEDEILDRLKELHHELDTVQLSIEAARAQLAVLDVEETTATERGEAILSRLRSLR